MTGLRERKRLQRRELILSCGDRLFGERGFDVTTMDAIAACADISPATLYNFFPTKLDILTEIFGRRIQDRLARTESVGAAPADDPVSAAHDLVTTLFESFADFDRGLLRRVTLNALNEGPNRDAGARYVLAESEMFEALVALLRRFQDAGGLETSRPVEDLAAAIFACSSGEYYVWLGDDDARLEVALANIRRHIAIILAAPQERRP